MRIYSILFTLFFAISASTVKAQIIDGLIVYYPFDECVLGTDTLRTVVDSSFANGGATIIGNPECACGVDNGNALKLDGTDDELIFAGPVFNSFNTTDFSVSLYIKPLSTFGTQTIMSKRDDCSNNHVFEISITPVSRSINVLLSENTSKQNRISATMDDGPCWHHVVVVRTGNKTQLYLNGTLRGENAAVSRVNIESNGFISVGRGPCVGVTNNPFTGYIDELRIYDRALDEEDVENLYVKPDQIANLDTLIFLGESVDVRPTNTCVNTFNWAPADGVLDPSSATTTITPPVKGENIYRLDFIDPFECSAFDSIRINVIDPDDLDCTEIFLPKAFTPNNDGRNDVYAISNPFAIDELISFEIFDRWGSKVFGTDNKFDAWDGTFRGELINPGVLLYKVRFRCGGEEKIDVGSLSILR